MASGFGGDDGLPRDLGLGDKDPGGGGQGGPPRGDPRGDPPGPTLADMFGGGTFMAGQGFDPSQGVFRNKRQARAFFPQRNPTQFGGGSGGGTPQTLAQGLGQRTAAPTGGGFGGGSGGGLGPSGPPQQGGMTPLGGPQQMGGGQNPGGVDPALWQNFMGQLAPGLPNGVGMGMLGQLGMAGGFDPMGSQGLIDMLRQQAMRDSGAQQRQNTLRAQLQAPEDRSLMAFANLQSGLQGQSDMSQNLMNAQLMSAMQNQNRLFGLGSRALGGHEGVKGQEHLARIQGDIQSGLQGGGFGDFLGMGLGSGLGAWLGPGGLFKGAGK